MKIETNFSIRRLFFSVAKHARDIYNVPKRTLRDYRLLLLLLLVKSGDTLPVGRL